MKERERAEQTHLVFALGRGENSLVFDSVSTSTFCSCSYLCLGLRLEASAIQAGEQDMHTYMFERLRMGSFF